MSTKSVSIEAANAFMDSDNWAAAPCARCGASLEHGGGYRESLTAQNAIEVDIICHDCIYAHDAAVFKRDSILQGSSLATTALLRYDFEVYRPFF